MNIKKGIKTLLKILCYVFICSILSNVFSFLLFLNTYSIWTNRFLGITCILLLIVGGFQLFTGNLKIMKNKFSGVFLILSIFFFLKPLNFNEFNYIITVSNNYDLDKIQEDKLKITEMNIDSYINLLSLKKEDIEFKKNIDNKFAVENIGNLKIYYESEACKKSIPDLIAIFNSFHTFIGDYFQINNDNKVEIVIKDTMDSDMLGAHNYITDRLYFKSKDSIDRLNQSDKSRSFEGVVVHEYTHMLFSKLYKNYLPDNYDLLPKWFSEGIATYYSKLYLNIPILKESYYSEDIRDDGNFVKATVIDEYEAAEALVNYIMGKGDKNFLITLFLDLQKEKNIYTSLEKILDEDFNEIESKVLLDK